MESIVLFASFFILLIMMVPIGYAIGIATLIAILVCGDGSVPLLMISQKAITGCDSFPLMAVPFFMLAGTVIVNGATTFMVGLSSAFAAYLSLTGIPRTLAAAMLGITDNKILLFVLINLFLLIVGCLVDNIPATIILAPILLPVVTALGMSPVTFGIMLTMNLAIGFCTPPYGIDLFVASAISGVSIGKMMKYMIWFLFALLVVLMLVTYWPAFTLFAFA